MNCQEEFLLEAYQRAHAATDERARAARAERIEPTEGTVPQLASVREGQEPDERESDVAATQTDVAVEPETDEAPASHAEAPAEPAVVETVPADEAAAAPETAESPSEDEPAWSAPAQPESAQTPEPARPASAAAAEPTTPKRGRVSLALSLFGQAFKTLFVGGDK